jgi:signal transduction histidine kinase
VSDDGVGFDTRAAGNPQPGKWGLVSMRQRAEAIGGQLYLKSSPGSGTTVGVELRR